MKKNSAFWYGILSCILAEVSYGVNGWGAAHLRALGMETQSILLYRFSLAAAILAIVLVIRREPLRTCMRDLLVGASCGFMFMLSALTLYISFTYMDSGLACTLLFVYPIMVVIAMAVIFHERITLSTALSIAVAMAGVALLSLGSNAAPGDGAQPKGVTLKGLVLTMISAATYAAYMIIYKRWPPKMSQYKMSFLSISFSALCLLAYSFIAGKHIQPISTLPILGYETFLAVVPTIISIFFTVEAIKYVGPTLTSILGALEPLTALFLGIAFLGEAFTPVLALGSALVLGAVIFVIIRPGQKQQTQEQQ